MSSTPMRVFLSSTSRDLKAHREAAFGAIQGMGYHSVQMEHFSGPAVPIEKFDHGKIAECDVFVILVGQLHGNGPSDSERSYTELEHETAVRLKKPIVVFLSDEDYPLTNIRESDAKYERQRAFRGRFTGLIRNSFTTPESLAGKIPLALHDLKAAAKEPGTMRPTPPQPYFVHPYPLQANFTGRVRERRMLTDWLTGGPNVLSIEAIGGMGKSALTWAWLQRDVLGFPLPGATEVDTDSPRLPEAALPEGVFWWSFYERDATFAAFVREALLYASGGQSNHEDPFRSLLTLIAQERFLLVLDGFERELRAYAGLNAAYQGDESPSDADARSCIDPHAASFLRWVASAPMRSRVLLTTRLHPREIDGLAGCRQRELKAIDPEDAIRFFQSQLIKGTRAEIQGACAPYGYHPLALRLLAGVIVKDHRKPRDIRAAARYPIAKDLIGREKHHILQVAYDAMDIPRRDLLNLLAAFRSPVSYESLVALNAFQTEAKLDAALDDLIERGLLLRGETQYDLHPVVRQHAYDRLTDKPDVHTRLRDYFAEVPQRDVDKIECVDDLAPVIELYHHTVRAGQYDEAFKLFQARLSHPLYYRLGAYQLSIDLLRCLFPDAEEPAPRLKDITDQGWTLNELANAHACSGQPREAVPLCLAGLAIVEKRVGKQDLAIGFGNVAASQAASGQLGEAHHSLRKSLDLARETQDQFWETVAHQELGRLEAHRGRFDQSLSELDSALVSFRELNSIQSECIVWAYRAIRSLLMNDSSGAVDYARRARELAGVERVENDIIRSEWLLGWSLISQAPTEAEGYLTEALTRCRRINNVENEPDILLAFGRLYRARKDSGAALTHAREALAIADRCEFRLVQADCHNLLAHLALDAGDRAAALRHAEIARERALCDDPEYCYKPALDEADALLAKLRP